MRSLNVPFLSVGIGLMGYAALLHGACSVNATIAAIGFAICIPSWSYALWRLDYCLTRFRTCLACMGLYCTAMLVIVSGITQVAPDWFGSAIDWIAAGSLVLGLLLAYWSMAVGDIEPVTATS